MTSAVSRGRKGADQRLERLLVMVPWVSSQEGPTVEEVCERFTITEAELAKDLELLFLCGLYPFTPDTLMEADIVDGRVWIRFADAFTRPPTFTRREAVSLVAAAAAVVELPQNEDNLVLQSALSKLIAALGLGDEGVVDVELAPAPKVTLDEIQRAARERKRVEAQYYSYGRDTWTTRSIEPYRVFNRESQWYVQARAVEVDELRTFRIDRMGTVSLTGDHFDVPSELPEPSTYTPRPEDPLVTLRLQPGGQWVIGQYPLESAHRLVDGSMQVALRVSESAWLERLLLRLGADGQVVSGCADTSALVDRLLERYKDN